MPQAAALTCCRPPPKADVRWLRTLVSRSLVPSDANRDDRPLSALDVPRCHGSGPEPESVPCDETRRQSQAIRRGLGASRECRGVRCEPEAAGASRARARARPAHRGAVALWIGGSRRRPWRGSRADSPGGTAAAKRRRRLVRAEETIRCPAAIPARNGSGAYSVPPVLPVRRLSIRPDPFPAAPGSETGNWRVIQATRKRPSSCPRSRAHGMSAGHPVELAPVGVLEPATSSCTAMRSSRLLISDRTPAPRRRCRTPRSKVIRFSCKSTRWSLGASTA